MPDSGYSPVLSSAPLGFVWNTMDPFLFCVHHDDAYPAGNERMGPAAPLAGRDLGQDFAGIDGWRMYHGRTVPGFPAHPHRGFETVTLVRRGLIDHSDSLGAAARFGRGDVQWMTAGRGVVHAEMFPLLDRSGGNPVELFQIWLNLPAADKMVDPHFSMLWADTIPIRVVEDGAGKKTEVVVVAGQFGDAIAPPPPPKSWASRPDSGIAIWTLRMEAGARFRLPLAQAEGRAGLNRMLYLFSGQAGIAGQPVRAKTGLQLRPDADVEITAGDAPVEFLLLQARPIAEPVVQHGPFVMNSQVGIQQAFADYQRTRFGGWPWPVSDPVHGREQGRFARHADGHTERRDG